MSDPSSVPSLSGARGLTAHQRNVLVAPAITGVPIDVLAERLRSTALHKTLHDPRRKLRGPDQREP